MTIDQRPPIIVPSGVLPPSGSGPPLIRRGRYLLPQVVHGPLDGCQPYPAKDFERRVGQTATRVWKALCARRESNGQVHMSLRGIATAPDLPSLTIRQTRRGLERLRQVGIVIELGHRWMNVPDRKLGRRRKARVYPRFVYGLPSLEIIEDPKVFAPPCVMLTPSGWGGKRSGAGRPRIHPPPPTYVNRLMRKLPAWLSPEHRKMVAAYAQVEQKEQDEYAVFKKEEKERRRLESRKKSRGGCNPEIKRGLPIGSIILRSKKSDNSFFSSPSEKKKKVGASEPPPQSFCASGGVEAGVVKIDWSTTPPTFPLARQRITPVLPELRPLPAGDQLNRVRASVPSGPRPGVSMPTAKPPIDEYVEGCGYRLGGSKNKAVFAGIPLWGKGCLPPYPDANIMNPARTPLPPLIPAALDEDAAAEWVMRTYRGACEARYKAPCRVLQRRGALAKSSFSATLKRAVREFRERDIAPAAWVAFSIMQWMGFGKDRTQKGKPVFPPLKWMFSPKRMAEQEGWFFSDKHLYAGGQCFYGPTGKEVLARIGMMQLELMRRLNTGRTEEDIKEQYFPGVSFYELVSDANDEAYEMQKIFNERTLRGDWMNW